MFYWSICLKLLTKFILWLWDKGKRGIEWNSFMYRKALVETVNSLKTTQMKIELNKITFYHAVLS